MGIRDIFRKKDKTFFKAKEVMKTDDMSLYEIENNEGKPTILAARLTKSKKTGISGQGGLQAIRAGYEGESGSEWRFWTHRQNLKGFTPEEHKDDIAYSFAEVSGASAVLIKKFEELNPGQSVDTGTGTLILPESNGNIIIQKTIGKKKK